MTNPIYVAPENQSRPNPFLISMTIVGTLAFAGGLIWGALSWRTLQSNFTADPALLLGVSTGFPLAGFGLMLLVVAWTVAAARFR